MIIHQGNMWDFYDDADYFIFTGNSYIKTNGALVMGRGMAKQVRDKFLDIDKVIGSVISMTSGHLGFYGLRFAGVTLTESSCRSYKIGVFQVKKHFKDKATTDIIKASMTVLKRFADSCNTQQIHMNYPGIGFGCLTKKVVYPIIEKLPDSVHIWTF